jgi:ABC-type proline/glycine betaine transport system ATPase subunit
VRNPERLKKSSPSGEAYKIRHQKSLWFGTFADSLQGYTVCSFFSWFIIFSMLFVLSAPSGTGKTTVANFIIRNVEDIRRVITCNHLDQKERVKWRVLITSSLQWKSLSRV